MSEIARSINVLRLTDKQNNAKNKIFYWYKNRNKPYFVLHGVAGSGKSTLVSYIVQELGLNHTVTAAYTGMATCVLLKKGNVGARTIHRLIYNVIAFKDEQGNDKFKFELKEELDELFELVIIDEVSMVNKEMIEHLLTFGVPILFVGDPEQLQPIFGSNQLVADAFLDEPMRQALDNPVIWLSNEIRHKNLNHLRVGSNFGDKIRIYSRDNFNPDILLNDQILAGKNATVDSLNDFYRRAVLGLDSRRLVEGDKVICLKNNWNTNNSEGVSLVNGLLGTIEDISLKARSQVYQFKFKPFLTTDFEDVLADRLLFEKLTPEALKDKTDNLKLFRSTFKNTNQIINEFKFGNAITVHKSQGSEFNSVTGFIEVLNRKDHHRWLYTLVTRTKDTLDLVI